MPATKKRKEASSTATAIKPYAVKKGEKYMNKKQYEHFRAKLLAWREELMGEITRTVHQMRDEPDNPPDPNDRASQETDMSIELRNRDRERKLIKKIDEALQRIDTSDYGFCDVCGVEIGIERLEARPTAELCIDCKTLDEIREKQMG
jgi:DnaK suppressor protein